MRILLAREIERLVAGIRALPDRSERKAVLLDRLRALRTKQIQQETGYRPRKRKSA
ncbi:hypothetical protein [Afipia carboxidovorans]|uniref:hypothetical protein n=1 Tax=Afipia carboxidovorans TaxID=40137 RepID=UPI003087B8E8|nr:hypothetical protein CRBSH125_01610 [Afipia carboxidovorans]